MWWSSFSLKCCEWCFDLTWKWSIPPFSPSFLSFTYIVTETHPSHLKSTVSGLSQFISLSPSVCPSAFPLPASLHPSCSCPPPSPQAQSPLWYSQSHLQSDIFNGLITLSSRSLIEHLTSTAHLLRPRCSRLTSTHLWVSNPFLFLISVIILLSCVNPSFLFPLYPPVLCKDSLLFETISEGLLL